VNGSSVRRPRLVNCGCCECWDCGTVGRFVVYPDDGSEKEYMNNIDDFGEFTERFWWSNRPGVPTKQHDLPIMALGLAGETGEALEHVKKFIRDDYLNVEELAKELGDVIHYWARICRYFGLKCSDVIAGNITKLESRRARGRLSGDGDNR
jgi:NTP pyrophosphatase (non-canonical NTP hydrolase)